MGWPPFAGGESDDLAGIVSHEGGFAVALDGRRERGASPLGTRLPCMGPILSGRRSTEPATEDFPPEESPEAPEQCDPPPADRPADLGDFF
jgi:hypothetical protein